MKSEMETGAKPNWYRYRHMTTPLRRYFGSRKSIAEGEVYVTHDLGQIVTMHGVSDNVCLHAGATIFDRAGSHFGAEIRCPIHKWKYDNDGTLLACPHFDKKQGARLTPHGVVEWNGYMFGATKAEIAHLSEFGVTLGFDPRKFDVGNFIFHEEKVYPVDYHYWLMIINYIDGLHVQYAHKLSFDAVVDSKSYRWEIGSDIGRPGYSIQLVQMRDNLEQHVARLQERENITRESLGWADLVLWLREVMPPDVWETPNPYFAMWGLDYASTVMWEAYINDLFMAVSWLIPNGGGARPDDYLNVVEYYVSPKIPEHLRRIATEKFIRAYVQSAREDDDLCRRLWSSHKRSDLNFRRSVHGLYEKGDHDFRKWVEGHSEETSGV